jgi:hypothetical protein
MIQAVSNEMVRLDAEGFYVRASRNRSWANIVETVKSEAAVATSWQQFYRAITRLDNAYPNLHAYSEVGETFANQLAKPITPLVRLNEEWLTPEKIRHVVNYIDKSAKYEASERPEFGDELIAINNRPIAEWEDENFNHCKWTLKAHCDFLLSTQLEQELLSWSREQPLTYTLKRGEKIWTIEVAIKTVEYKKRDPSKLYCKNFPDRYLNFKLVYAGNRACIYQNPSQPETAILRITSFLYSALNESENINSVFKEIQQLYPWWQQHAHWQHLVIDVINNGGGNAPIPYYQLLLQNDFQEQYTSFKKIPEMLNSQLREKMFWGSPSQEIWFQNLLKTGVWEQTPMYSYLPPVPMFCADQDRNCLEGRFQPFNHPSNSLT